MGKQAIGGATTGQGGARMPYSKAIRAGDLVFVSGQVAFGADGRLVDGGIEAQTRQVMDNIRAILADAGCTMADVVKCTAWLDDARDFAGFNQVYIGYFDDPPPARSCVASSLMIDAKVEVEAIAHHPA